MFAVGAAAGAPLNTATYAYMDAAWGASATAGAAARKFAVDYAAGCALWQAAYCSLPRNDAYRAALAGAAAGAAAAARKGARAALERARRPPAELFAKA